MQTKQPLVAKKGFFNLSERLKDWRDLHWQGLLYLFESIWFILQAPYEDSISISEYCFCKELPTMMCHYLESLLCMTWCLRLSEKGQCGWKAFYSNSAHWLKGHMSELIQIFIFIPQIKGGSWYFRLEASSNTELATFPRWRAQSFSH